MNTIHAFFKVLFCFMAMILIAGIAVLTAFVLEQPGQFFNIASALCLLWLTAAVVYFAARFCNLKLKHMKGVP